MSNKNDELSADESEALRRELEARASGNAPAASAAVADDDGEDLEAFLKSLEEDDYEPPAPRVATADPAADDPFAAQFAELEATHGKAIAISEPEKPTRQQRKEAEKLAKKQAAEQKAAEKQAAIDAANAEKQAQKDAALAEKQARKEEKNAGKRHIALRILTWTALGLPVFCLWWLVGSYLAQWISAAWLIALVTTSFVFGLPGLLRHFTHRGRYVYWLSGTGLLLTIALAAPMPATAAKNLAEYGHWPASTIAEVSGLPVDHALVRLNTGVAGAIGGLLNPIAKDQPAHRLGTEMPLSGPQAVPAPTPTEPATTEPTPAEPSTAEPVPPAQTAE